MIDKNYGAYVLICDICGNEADQSFDTFDNAIDAKNELGWRSERGEQLDLKDGWVDLCPDCQQEVK